MIPSSGPPLSGLSLIGDLLDRGSIAPSVGAGSKRQALAIASEQAARAYGVKSSRVLDALLAREALGSTGVGHGVALPHAEVEGFGRIRGVFLRLRPPIDYGSVDDEPVDLLLAILAPPGAAIDHLRMLARVARALRRPDLRQQLRAASGVDAIQALLTQEARSSAA